MSQASRGHDHRDAQGGGASTGRGGLDRSMVRQRGRWTPAQRAQRVRWLLALVAPQTAPTNVDIAALIHSARERVVMTSRAAWYDARCKIALHQERVRGRAHVREQRAAHV